MVGLPWRQGAGGRQNLQRAQKPPAVIDLSSSCQT
jgi:hypothetical protein